MDEQWSKKNEGASEHDDPTCVHTLAFPKLITRGCCSWVHRRRSEENGKTSSPSLPSLNVVLLPLPPINDTKLMKVCLHANTSVGSMSEINHLINYHMVLYMIWPRPGFRGLNS